MSTFPSNMAGGGHTLKLEWSDLTVILAICRTGSLSGAARLLGHNHSTVFRRINAIEERTGVRFFERLPDGYAMTGAGATALRYAERIEAEVDALGREVLGQDMKLSGKIHLTAMEGFALMVAPALAARFRERHPEVTVEITGSTGSVDLSRREADVAVRATPKPPDTSLGRKVCDFRFALYAAPSYLQRARDVPVPEMDWVMISNVVEWLVPLIWKKKAQGERQVVYSSHSAISTINAAAAGLGITLMPCYLGDSDDRLVRVSEPLPALSIELWVLTHQDLRHTARVRALMQFLYEELDKDRALYEGDRPRDGGVVLFAGQA